MGVYIKGMEMPTSCRRCGFSQPDGCGFVCPITVGKPIVDSLTHSRHARCPLVPVPQHGRLIDADKMKESIRKQTAFLRLIGGESAEIAETLEKGFLQEIDNAPTIIPAEPCNNLPKPCKEEAKTDA